ncbi:hypothetical protein LCGC14_1364190 [marine sediment metagenome]|uniref:PD-(D/E)XK endonuclease-like domain-containing protein n=1 Tax=marine sediment metagenome TaxID=412755 RepID=A0A0F9K7S1_9ZZZZ
MTDHCYDSTQLNNFRRCPQFYNNRHVKGLVLDGGSKHSDPLAAGSAIHKGVEAWFSTGDSEKAINAVKATWGEDDLFLPEKAKYTQGFLTAVMAGYADAWPRENDSFKVLANEQWLQSGNYGGIVDRLVEEDGVYVMDTKTTSGWVNERYIESFQLSSQFRGYVWLARQAGYDCQGAYLDAVHLDTRYHKVKASDFVREKILYSEEQIGAWRRDAIETEASIEQQSFLNMATGRWPQNDQRCFDWNRPCPYWRLCTAVIPENELDFYKEERWEPWTK